MEEENEGERDGHLYFIGPDTAMPVKLMSQLSRGGRETVEEELKSEKRKKEGEMRGRCKKKKRKCERSVKRQQREERERLI